jgi:4a-hydroxytetrahydrobiopterin dehydratase
MTLLTEDEITAGLGRVAGWERAGDSITRTVKLGDFRDAILYVGAVAHLAQAANHHPDIAISWNTVTLTLSTHSAGGLTTADLLATAAPRSALTSFRARAGHVLIWSCADLFNVLSSSRRRLRFEGAARAPEHG